MYIFDDDIDDNGDDDDNDDDYDDHDHDDFSLKITLYTGRDFKERSKDFTESCPDLLDDITTSSLSVKCKRGV